MKTTVIHFGAAQRELPPRISPSLSLRTSITLVALPYLVASVGDGAVPLYLELAGKIVFNALSTSAHVFKGAVYKNVMINVRVSNHKLYVRAVHIIQRLCSATAMDAEEVLLRSIYATDDGDFVQSNRAFHLSHPSSTTTATTASSGDGGKGQAGEVEVDSDVVETHLEEIRKRRENRGSAVPLAVLLYLAERGGKAGGEKVKHVSVEEAEGMLDTMGGVRKALDVLMK
uniref:Uncharacterized protein n=1 Tax=Palpitomonas bilix TaxID=652834 RepID=A0A7S3DJ68_9EUKA|mmetsp:Transcript_40302/g.104464  ORF Transcript_40302/g.104464 Transcript_40302/m.104464 type:complete len:229 (+) Transcript_40302:278-964(+)